MEIPELMCGPGADDLLSLAHGRITEEGAECPNLTDKPLYKNLTILDLQALRCALYGKQLKGFKDLKPWAETTMRFCEIHRWHIEGSMRSMWGRQVAPVVTVLTTAFLVEVHLVSNDYRFLNTALKMRASCFFPSERVNAKASNRVMDLAQAVHQVINKRLERCRII